MARSFPVSVIFRGVDNISATATAAFGKVEERGKKAASKIRAGFKRAMTTVGVGAMGAAAVTKEFADKAIAYEDQLFAIRRQGGLTQEQIDEIDATARRLSSTFGESRGDMLAGVSALVDLQGAAAATPENMELMAKAMLAVKDPTRDIAEQMQEMAGITFALNNAFKFKDAGEAEDALSAVIQAGKDGSIPLGEMGQVLQQVAADFAKVADGGKMGAAQLSAALQVARTRFGSAAEAGTGLKNLIGSLTGNAARFAKSGVKVFDKLPDGRKTLKPLSEIMDQIGRSKLAKDPEALQKAFGSKEALTFFEALSSNKDAYDGLVKAALESKAVQEDSFSTLNSKGQQYRKGLQDIENAMTDAFDKETITFVVEAFKGFAGILNGIVKELHDIQQALVGWADAEAEKKVAALAKSEQGFVDAIEDSDKAIKNRAATELHAMMAAEGLLDKAPKTQEEFLAASARVAELSGIARQRAQESQRRRVFEQSQALGIVDEAGNVNRDILQDVVAEARPDLGGSERVALQDQILRSISESRGNVQGGPSFLAPSLGIVSAPAPRTQGPAVAAPASGIDKAAQQLNAAAEKMNKSSKQIDSAMAKMAAGSNRGARG